MISPLSAEENLSLWPDLKNKTVWGQGLFQWISCLLICEFGGGTAGRKQDRKAGDQCT